MYYDRTFTVMLDYISIFVNVSFLKKIGHSRSLFIYFRLFNSQKCTCLLIFFADGWIQTTDL